MDREFLEAIATEYQLSPEQRAAFVLRFDPAHLGESEAKLSSHLNIGASTFKKRMTEVYKKLALLCPELASAKRGKVETLRAALQHRFEQGVLQKPRLKLGAPMPGVRLPENFVPRPDALAAVKAKLLAEGEQTLVVSAISGLGGIGKSVLATAIVLDSEVQERFKDGILWKTLGQQPDLLSCLVDWIRELDKSRDTYSANTVEAASRYLGALLAKRRMLLVVDDVWNSPDAEWFRVGGPGCRVLVTTRTAVISGVKPYPLDLMSPEESVELIQGELGDRWSDSMEEPAKEFAELLGYLPLALRLMAVQLKRGRSWGMLKRAFLQETKRLRSFKHPGVKLERLSEEERREYSLRSCFGLSLQWLEPELLERFIWLGVLPEDAV